MSKTVVILGASLSGVPIAHHLLKHTAPLVPGLKVILVSPNTDFYWNLASVRGILPDMLPDEKLFHPLAPAFAKYPKSQFEFVVGLATSLDPDASSVLVTLGGGSGAATNETRSIPYHTLVIATGSSAREGMPWKGVGSTEETKATLHAWQEKIRKAKSVVVAGAGTTGVEVAGELGQEYALGGLKSVTLVVEGDLPLTAESRRDLRQNLVKELEKLKVKIVSNRKVTAVHAATATNGATTNGAGAGTSSSSSTAPPATPGPVRLELTSAKDGTTESLQADVYIPTFGLVPNTDFLPASMVDGTGRVKTDTRLRAEGHEGIYAIGDVSNLQTATAMHVEAQIHHVVKDLQARLLKGEKEERSKAGLAAAQTVRAGYKPDDKVLWAVSLGRNKGAGQAGAWKVPGFLVAWIKSRFIGTQYAGDIAAGSRSMNSTKW